MRAWRQRLRSPGLLLVALAYLPPLLTARGQVATDTKQYLYLSPGRLLAGASSLWDPSQFGGYVTHQTIGYLWPMGPFHLLLHAIGCPAWIAQRLWIGTVIVAAGTGVYVLCRKAFGFTPLASLVAGALYQCSPYLLSYVNRTSVLLTPWAGLGWLLLATIQAARRGGWRWPATFALVVATIGGINATALALIALAPLAWLVHATLVSREITRRRAVVTAARLVVLSLAVSLWWIASLVVQAGHGADVLAYSETVQAVSTTASAGEGLRGLGYWLFYGGDVNGRWNSASTAYLQSPGLMLLGFGLAALCLLAAATVRWRERAFVAVLVASGIVIASLTHPPGHGSLLGRLLTRGGARSTLVLALRSSTRALPLTLLGLALAMGAAVTVLAPRWRRGTTPAALAVLALTVANLPALWTGTLVDRLLRRPEHVPSAWVQAAAALSTPRTADTRILQIPGQEFGAYRWGTTTDPLLPGLTDRPVITRDLLPLGGAFTTSVLNALDDRYQLGTAEPAALAPVASLLSVGDVVVPGDAAYERYRTTPPARVAAQLDAGVPGLGALSTFGPPSPNEAPIPVIDDLALADPSSHAPVAPVTVAPVSQTRPIVRVESVAAPVLLAGDGDGVVDAAAAGLVTDQVVLPTAALDDTALAAAAAQPGATLVITDTNRKRAHQWRGSQDQTGATEDAGPTVLQPDPADARLPVFPDQTIDDQTIALQRGGRATASSYGEPNAYRPEDRPALAFDGDESTAWQVADRADADGAQLHLELPDARAVDHLSLVQVQHAEANRWITTVRVTTAAGSVEVELDDASRSAAGQVVRLPADRPTTFVDIEIVATSAGRGTSAFGLDAVGFAEVVVPGITITEAVRPPVRALSRLAGSGVLRSLTYVLTRERVDPLNRWRDDPERALDRLVTLPAGGDLTIVGTARPSVRASAAVLATVIAPTEALAIVTSSSLGSLDATGGRAFDGDARSAWTPAFGDRNPTLTVSDGHSHEVDHVQLAIVADGRHSVPTTMTITSGGETRTIALPTIVDGVTPGASTILPLAFPALTGTSFTISFPSTRPTMTVDRRYGEEVATPIAIAEIDLDAMRAASDATTIDTGCRTDLLTIDGLASGVRITGDVAALRTGAGLSVVGCGAALHLDAGVHELRAVAGRTTGIDLDRLVLHIGTTPGAIDAAAAAAGSSVGDTRPTALPVVTLTNRSHTTATVSLAGGAAPFWLVQGDSYERGWQASIGGRSLGPPTMIDGGSNGWRIDPAAWPHASGSALVVQLRWAPQSTIDLALVLSALAAAVCLALALWPRRTRLDRVLPIGSVGHPDPIASCWNLPASSAVVTPRAGLWLAAATGAIAAVVVDPLSGLALATLVAVASRRRLARRALLVLPAGVAALVGLFYAARQVHSRPVPGFGWVSAFEPAHRAILLAVLALVAGAILDLLTASPAGDVAT